MTSANTMLGTSVSRGENPATTYSVSAPTRVDLAGGTLDLWPLYCLFGGAKTINAAISLRARASFEILPSVTFKTEIVTSTGESYTLDEIPDLDESRSLSPSLQFPVVILGAFLRQVPVLPEKFIRIKLQTEAPLKSGLGGSSSLCVALVRGLSRTFGGYTDLGWQWKMLPWVRDVEAGFLKTATGTQDYCAAM